MRYGVTEQTEINMQTNIPLYYVCIRFEWFKWNRKQKCCKILYINDSFYSYNINHFFLFFSKPLWMPTVTNFFWYFSCFSDFSENKVVIDEKKKKKMHLLTYDIRAVCTQQWHGIDRSHSHCTQCTRCRVYISPAALCFHSVPLSVELCLFAF